MTCYYIYYVLSRLPVYQIVYSIIHVLYANEELALITPLLGNTSILVELEYKLLSIK